MAVGEGLEDLLQALGGAALGVEAPGHDVVEELATGYELEHEEVETRLLRLSYGACQVTISGFPWSV